MSCEVPVASVCEAASALYSPGSAVFYNLALRALIEPVCISTLVLLCVAVKRTKALHFNVRCLLICMLGSMILSNLGVLLTSVHALYIVILLPVDSRCEALVYSPNTCLRLRQLWASGGVGLAVSTLFIAVERFLATIRFRNYESVPLKWFGLTLCAIQIFTAIFPIIFAPPNRCFPFCAAEFVFPENSRISSQIFFALNFISLLAFVCLFRMNQKRRVDIMHGALSRKFQLKENVSTTRLMVPVMIVVAMMTCSAALIFYFFLPVLDYESTEDPEIIAAILRFARYYEFQAAMMPFLSFAMLFLLPYFSQHIKKSLYALCYIAISFPKEGNMKAEEVKDLYFDQLRGQWENVNRRTVLQ